MVGWFKRGPRCIYGLHIKHRGVSVRQAMESRAALRKNRRCRKLRYRQPRFNNRTRPPGWVPPSIESRVSNVMTWVRRLLSNTPASQVYFEVVKFDTDAMANVTRDQYSTDARIRTQMRHYLLTTRGNVCSYCKGVSADARLEREHVIPRSRGGTDALANAELACRRCNIDKGTMLLSEWLNALKGRTDPLSVARLKHIPKCVRRIRHSLRDASIMNWTRYIIVRRIRDLGIRVIESPSWETTYNRNSKQYTKVHWIDAACVGYAPHVDENTTIYTAVASGYGNRQMIKSDKYGFPRGRPKGPSSNNGFRSGDMCKLNQRVGKYKGTYVGRLTIRTTGWFDIRYLKSKITSKYTNYVLLHSNDGYMYTTGTGIPTITIK